MILTSRQFFANLEEPDLVKPPVVYAAGMLRGSDPRADTMPGRGALSNMACSLSRPTSPAGRPTRSG